MYLSVGCMIKWLVQKVGDIYIAASIYPLIADGLI